MKTHTIYLTFSLMLILLFSSKASSSGSMRIDVEVYNGPLSKTLEIQKAELMGTLSVTDEALKLLAREFHLSQCRLGCFGTNLDSNEDICHIPTAAKIEKHFSGNQPYDTALKEGFIIPSKISEQYQHLFPIQKEHNWFEYDVESKIQKNKTLTEMINELNETESSQQVKDEKKQILDKLQEVKDFDFWGFNKRRIRKSLPISKEDELHRVCPVLSDVKHNILATLTYIYKPLTYPAKQTKHLNNTLLNCQRKLLDKTNTDNNQDNNETRAAKECLTKIAKVGKILQEGAELWATTQMSILPKSRRERVVVTRASIAAAELGNELAARADAISRQQANGLTTASLLPTSNYLRDAEGTDYLNLANWLDATRRKEKRWSPDSRTRMIERLITDSNWSKVNTAFAQGVGDTSMVFVKDNIGNWNLKSYENDPTETLKAYKEVGSALLSSAVKMAKGTKLRNIGQSLAGIKNAEQQANQLLLGSTDNSNSADISDNNVKQLELQLKQRLRQEANRLFSLNKELKQKQEVAKEQLEELKKGFASLESTEPENQAYYLAKKNIEDKEREIQQIEIQLQQAPVTSKQVIKEIISSHKSTLENLQQALVTS